MHCLRESRSSAPSNQPSHSLAGAGASTHPARVLHRAYGGTRPAEWGVGPGCGDAVPLAAGPGTRPAHSASSPQQRGRSGLPQDDTELKRAHRGTRFEYARGPRGLRRAAPGGPRISLTFAQRPHFSGGKQVHSFVTGSCQKPVPRSSGVGDSLIPSRDVWARNGQAPVRAQASNRRSAYVVTGGTTAVQYMHRVAPTGISLRHSGQVRMAAALRRFA